MNGVLYDMDTDVF